MYKGNKNHKYVITCTYISKHYRPYKILVNKTTANYSYKSNNKITKMITVKRKEINCVFLLLLPGCVKR